MKPIKILVFTDLDGTFLDHHSYGFQEALPALERLKNLGAIVVPVTSKTMAEIDALNLPFGKGPKVAENGMVMLDVQEKYNCAKTYQDILEFIGQLPENIRAHIQGFSDMSVAEVANKTGLPEESAVLAKTRLASEPFLWSGTDIDLSALKKYAAQQDLQITRGGRFYHLMGAGGKDRAVLKLIEQYKAIFPKDRIISIALGDGPNDAKMLSYTDYAVQIPNENGVEFEIENPQGIIMQALYAGPKGWGASIQKILDTLKI